QELNPFAGQFSRLYRHAGNIASRPRQRVNHAAANGIDCNGEHDRDCRGRVLRSRNCASDRHNHIHLETRKLRGDLAKALCPSLRPAIFDGNCATLNPTKFTQPLDKGGSPMGPCRLSACAQKSDCRQLRWLSVSSNRPCQRASEKYSEFASPHGGPDTQERTSYRLSHGCPLWVISRHLRCKTACPLYPR